LELWEAPREYSLTARTTGQPRALCEIIWTSCQKKTDPMIFGAMRDKALNEMAAILFPKLMHLSLPAWTTLVLPTWKC